MEIHLHLGKKGSSSEAPQFPHAPNVTEDHRRGSGNEFHSLRDTSGQREAVSSGRASEAALCHRSLLRPQFSCRRLARDSHWSPSKSHRVEKKKKVLEGCNGATAGYRTPQRSAASGIHARHDGHTSAAPTNQRAWSTDFAPKMMRGSDGDACAGLAAAASHRQPSLAAQQKIWKKMAPAVGHGANIPLGVGVPFTHMRTPPDRN